MKINNKSLEFANQNIGNMSSPILFYMSDSEKKLNPLDYQTYKLRTNPKDKKSAVYNLVVKYCKVETPEEWLQFMETITQVIKGQDIQDGDAAYLLVTSLLKGDALQVFKHKDASQEVYKTQNKYIRNIRKPAEVGILQMDFKNDKAK
eukprot:13523340-Ditylum_brightwellii.AAC.1